MKPKKTGKAKERNIPAAYSLLVKKLQQEKKIHFLTPLLFTRQ